MVELRRVGPLDGKTAEGAHPAANLRALPPAAQFMFRGTADAAILAGNAFGAAFPRALRATTGNNRTILWLGPDEFLLLAPANEEAQIEATIAASLGTTPYALVGVSHRNTALEISGVRAARLLNAGCPLDLDDRAFPVAMCTRTVLAKAPIVLWRTAADAFYVSAWRSFAPYVWEFLVEARSRL